MVSAEFERACEDVLKFNKEPDSAFLLDIYGWFKIASGADLDSSPAPSRVGWKEQIKRSRWAKLVAEGMTPEEAEQKYIRAVEENKEKFDYDPDKVPSKKK